MMQVLLSVAAYFRRLGALLVEVEDYANEQERWRHDPLAHPDIVAMTERERADLPFRSHHENRGCVDR